MLLVESSAGLGPGLERENKQLAARVKAGPGVAQVLKKESEARDLVARLVEHVVANLTPEEIQQLNEILALRGQTVEQLDAEAEARRDVAQASGEQAAAATGAGNATGGTGGGIPFVPDNEGIAGQLGRPFEIAVGDIQQEFAGLFDRLFEDGIGAFANMGRNIKGIFKNLASNIARTLIFQPQVLGIGGLGG